MANETIPLAKHEFRPDKLEYPVLVSEKLDGVPVKFTIIVDEYGNTSCSAVTRQGEQALSCLNYVQQFAWENAGKLLPGYEYIFVWEVTHDSLKGFKDISGVVRRQSPQEGLVFNLFDFDAYRIGLGPASKVGYHLRMESARRFTYYTPFRVIPQTMAYNDQELVADVVETPMALEQEGWVIRSHDAPFKPGTRHWDYQVIVKEPTIDLQIVGFEEGKGKNAGGVGKLIALYKGDKIGVGPGKLTYTERKELWDLFGEGPVYDEMNAPNHPIAKIKYKPDPGYKALRQPTFQAWHTKSEPDA